MKKALVLALVLLTLGAATPASAIPAFARRYGVTCQFCHAGYPKLNESGQRFKERGFRMEGERFDARQWLESVPVVIRGSANHLLLEQADDATTGFFKAVSAGNLGQRIAYWVDDAVLVTEEDVQHVEPDNAWLRIELVELGRLHLKAGRFELDLPFTQTRTSHLFSYEIYFASTGFEGDELGGFHEGVELGGQAGPWRGSIAVVKGRNDPTSLLVTEAADEFDANLFLRLRRRADRNRFGLFAYLGTGTLGIPAACPGAAAPCPEPPVWENELQRIGLDADVWLDRLNLYGVALWGRNDNSIATRARPQGTGEALSFSGGFVQADWHFRDHLVMTARLNLLDRPLGGAGSRGTALSVFPGLQFFVRERLKLSFEYGFTNEGRADFGALQAEVAF